MSAVGELEAGSRDRQVLVIARFALVAIIFVFLLMEDHPADYLPGAVGLAVVAVVGSVPPLTPLMARWQPVVEAVLAAAVVSVAEPLATQFLPYLLITGLAAGLAYGVTGAVLAAGLAGAVIIVSHIGQLDTDEFNELSVWVLVSLGVGLFAAWVRRGRSADQPSADVAAYSEAYRLLEQLRAVSRHLSGGLEPASVASNVAEHTRDKLGVPVVVVTRSDSGVLVPLARAGAMQDGSLQALDAIDSTSTWQQSTPTLVDGTAWMPLRVADRTIAMVVAATADATRVETLAPTLSEDALRLETALMFEDVRTLATAEERRRLAREIHDGIAQELASLGYLVDGMAVESADQALTEDLALLRSEISRVVSELRLSIFDLRNEVSGTTGLGEALSDYVREVGRRSGLTVHLVLDEGPHRLPATAEAQLLRIAQEAVTNARRHAQARNLWVSCQVDPPRAHIRVEDDGRGLGKGRSDSYGLGIMAERAERAGARLVIGARPGGGTIVDARIGPDLVEKTADRSSVQGSLHDNALTEEGIT